MVDQMGAPRPPSSTAVEPPVASPTRQSRVVVRDMTTETREQKSWIWCFVDELDFEDA